MKTEQEIKNTIENFYNKYRVIENAVLENLRNEGVELPEPSMKTHGAFDTKEKPWFTAAQMLDYGDRRAAALRAQVELLCAEIEKADKLLREGKDAEALVAVRRMACVASASYLKYIGRAAAAVPQWIPISSAPKDGREVLLGHPDGSAAVGYWSVRCEAWNVEDDLVTWPTHWMPLPQPPKEQS